MVGTIRALGEEFAGLLSRTFALWWRLLPWLVGFTLIGWAGYYGAVLAGSELAHSWPWLVAGALAVGVVVQLAATVGALRLAVVRAGVSPAEVGHTTPVHLLSQTVLPFLAIFAAFGFIDGYARDVVIVVSQRYSAFGGSNFLNSLNPLESTTATVVVAGAVVGLFVLRRVLEVLAERTGWVWLGLTAAVVEAAFGLVLLLSAFRLVEQFWLWLDDREVAAWWDGLVDAVSGWITVPPALADAWQFVAESAWPVAWDLLSQPIAWLALTAVVAGFRQARAEGPGVPRTGAGRLGREVFAGDVDDKYLPLWHALRFLARAGWPLLGAYVLAFTVLDWAGDLLSDTLITLAGPFAGEAAVVTMPFLGLVPHVLVLSVRFALLAVATARAGQAPTHAGEQPGGGVLQAVVVAAVCIAVALSSLALKRDNGEIVVRGEIGETVAIMTTTAMVADPRTGSSLVEPGAGAVDTDLSFVVVSVTVSQERDGLGLTAELRAGGRSYSPWDGPTGLSARPGFSSRRDVVFEVDPDDLAGPLVLRLVPSVFITNGSEVGEVTLPPLEPAGAASYDSIGSEWVP